MLLKGFFASRTEILKRKSMSHSKSTVSGRGKRQGAQHSMRGWVLSHWGQRVYLQLKSWNNESVPSSRRVSGWSQIRRSGRGIRTSAMCYRGWTPTGDWARGGWKAGTGARLGAGPGFILRHSCSGRKLQVMMWNFSF